MLRHIAALIDGLARDWRRIRTMQALSALSDQQLADIGLGRNDVVAMARGVAARRSAAIGRIVPNALSAFDFSAPLLTSASARSRA